MIVYNVHVQSSFGFTKTACMRGCKRWVDPEVIEAVSVKQKTVNAACMTIVLIHVLILPSRLICMIS